MDVKDSNEIGESLVMGILNEMLDKLPILESSMNPSELPELTLQKSPTWEFKISNFDDENVVSVEDSFDSEETFVFSLKSKKPIVTDSFVIADCQNSEGKTPKITESWTKSPKKPNTNLETNSQIRKEITFGTSKSIRGWSESPKKPTENIQETSSKMCNVKVGKTIIKEVLAYVLAKVTKKPLEPAMTKTEKLSNGVH